MRCGTALATYGHEAALPRACRCGGDDPAPAVLSVHPVRRLTAQGFAPIVEGTDCEYLCISLCICASAAQLCFLWCSRPFSPLLFRSASPIHRNDTVRSSPALPGTTRHDTMHFTRYPSIYYTTPPHIPTCRALASLPCARGSLSSDFGVRISFFLSFVFSLSVRRSAAPSMPYALCLALCLTNTSLSTT